MDITIQICDKNGTVLAQECDPSHASLVYNMPYNEGDYITLCACGYLVIQLDDVMNSSFVHMKSGTYTFKIPFNEKKVAYNPKSFTGDIHLLTARIATPDEISCRKNLCHNEYDSHNNAVCFPHAYANVETRGESVFAARNAINGNLQNRSHGNWPYESWGINRDPDATITVEFGRTVLIDQLVLQTRADFPHDNWWKQATFTFSDGTTFEATMQKSNAPHVFNITPRCVSSISLSQLKKDDTDPSPFPALTQIMAYGSEQL